MDSISENLRRAQEAIARARALSTQLSSLCLSQQQTSATASTTDTSQRPAANDQGAAGEQLSAAGPEAGVVAPAGMPLSDRDPVRGYRASLEQSDVTREASVTGRQGDDEAGWPAAPSGSWRSSYQRLSGTGAPGASAAAAAPDTYGLTARSAIPRYHSGMELDALEAGGGAAAEDLGSYHSRGGRGGDTAGGLALDGDGGGGYRGRGDGGGGGGSDPGVSGGEGEGGGDLSSRLTHLAGPVLAVATQLASLQRKQSETLQQLLVLRMQQLKCVRGGSAGDREEVDSWGVGNTRCWASFLSHPVY